MSSKLLDIDKPVKQKSGEAIIFQTHVLNRFVVEQFAKLVKETEEYYDVFVMTDTTLVKDREFFSRLFLGEYGYLPIIYVDNSQLHTHYFTDIKTERREVFRTTEHLPFVEFCKQLPTYKGLWRIEYDVCYTGDWANLLSQIDSNQPDLATTSILDYEDCRHFWSHWRRTKSPVPVTQLTRAHNALMRMSREAALKVGEFTGDEPHQYRGHYEVLLPTIVKQCGLNLVDIGGYSKYTPSYRWGQHYQNLVGTGLSCKSDSTFSAFGNFFDTDKAPSTLYHPVKVPSCKMEDYKI